MMKKVWGLLLAASLAAWQTGDCLGQAPKVGFVAPGPGINAPLNTHGEGVDYGWKQLQTGTWTFDGDSATIDNTNGAVLRYWTSSLGDTAAGPVTAMSDTEDWVMELIYRHTGAYGGEWPWYLKAETSDERIVHLRHVGGAGDDTWRIAAGVVDGGWGPIGATFALGSGFNKFTVHYKADTQRIDVYLNGTIISGVSDIALEHGNYKADFLQLEWQRSGVDSFRSVRLGQLVPEPASMALVGLAMVGSTCLLGRRRR